MNWTKWVDRKASWLGVPHLPIVLVLGHLLVFFASLPQPQIALLMALDRDPLFEHLQIWRLFTWAILPGPVSFTGWSVFMLFISLLVLWLEGQSLENLWGRTVFTLYVLIGIVSAWVAPLAFGYPITSSMLLVASIFVAFAYEFPDFEFLLFFILPVKVKWLAAVLWAVWAIALVGALAFAVGGGVRVEPGDGSAELMRWGPVVLLLCAPINFFLFFGWPIVQKIRGNVKRANLRAAAVAAERAPKHKCSVCGVTDFKDPEMDFRYLPGNRCICIDCLDAGKANQATE